MERTTADILMRPGDDCTVGCVSLFADGFLHPFTLHWLRRPRTKALHVSSGLHSESVAGYRGPRLCTAFSIRVTATFDISA